MNTTNVGDHVGIGCDYMSWFYQNKKINESDIYDIVACGDNCYTADEHEDNLNDIYGTLTIGWLKDYPVGTAIRKLDPVWFDISVSEEIDNIVDEILNHDVGLILDYNLCWVDDE